MVREKFYLFWVIRGKSFVQACWWRCAVLAQSLTNPCWWKREASPAPLFLGLGAQTIVKRKSTRRCLFTNLRKEKRKIGNAIKDGCLRTQYFYVSCVLWCFMGSQLPLPFFGHPPSTVHSSTGVGAHWMTTRSVRWVSVTLVQDLCDYFWKSRVTLRSCL